MLSLQELADRSAIREVLVRYFRGVDKRDYELIKSCYTSDCYNEYAHGFKETGTEKVIKMISGVEHFRATMHFMGNQFIEVNGDTAKSETYCIAHHLTPLNDREERDMVQGLRYVDQLVRVNGGWKIKHRVQLRDWGRFDTTAKPPAHGQPLPSTR